MKQYAGWILTFTAVTLLLCGCAEKAKVQRYGSVIGLKKEQVGEYKRLHAEVWPEVLALLKEANIRNYSIHLTQFDDGKFYLFSYLEYTGSDVVSDFAKLGDAAVIKKWWTLNDPMQQPLASRGEGEHWKNMEEVFHMP